MVSSTGAIPEFSLRYIVSQKYHDINKYCDIIVLAHVTRSKNTTILINIVISLYWLMLQEAKKS